VAAIIDAEDYKAIAEALALAEEALIKDLEEVDFKIEPDINKKKCYICDKIGC